MKATPEQLKEWNEKHGQIFELEFEGKYCYLSDPLKKLTTVKALLTALDKGMYEYIESLLNNCWVGGDDSIKTDDKAKTGLIDIGKQMIDIPEADVDLDAEPDKAVVTVDGKVIVLKLAARGDIKYAEDRNKAGKLLDSQIHLLERIAEKEELVSWREDVPRYVGLLMAVDKLKQRKYVALKKALEDAEVSASDFIRQYDALIEYHTRRNPDELTDEQWASICKNIEWVRDQEKKRGLDNLNKLFGG